MRMDVAYSNQPSVSMVNTFGILGENYNEEPITSKLNEATPTNLHACISINVLMPL